MQYKKHSQERVTRGYGLLEIFLAKQRAKKAKSLISQKLAKGRVLDVGCGAFPYFLSSLDFGEKYGIDFSLKPDIFNSLSIHLTKGDIEKDGLPYPDNFFDTVTMLAVFEHIDKKKTAFILDEVRRVLKKRGVFVITTPAPWSNLALRFLSKIGLVSKIEIDDHKHALFIGEIKKELIKAKFTKVESGFFELFFNMWFKSVK